MKKTVIWLDNYLEEFFMVISLILMTVIMGIQVFSRYVLGSAPSWSEEITRYLFVWSGFLSVSYCTKKCISIKIEQFVSIFPRRGKALFKLVSFLTKPEYDKGPQSTGIPGMIAGLYPAFFTLHSG